MNSRYLIRIVSILLTIACWLHGRPSFAASYPGASVPIYAPVLSDFDGDHKVDQVTLFSSGSKKRIDVLFGTFASRSLRFDSPDSERGRIYSGDFDRDGDTDLLWLSQSYPRKFVMWLGDGRGNFSLLRQSNALFDTLTPLLDEGSESRLAGGSCNDGLACILLSLFCAGPIHASPQISFVCERVIASDQVLAFSPFWLHLAFERGPPSRLS